MTAMDALDALDRDHRDIDAMLGVFEAVLDRLDAGRYVDPEMLAGILGFFQRFARCHHAKEETALFPSLGASARALGLVPSLIAQHAALHEMLDALSGGPGGVPSEGGAAGRTFIAVARTYIATTRDHVALEDRFLRDVAAGLIPPPRDAELVREMQAIERARLGPTGREWYKQVIADYRDIVATWGRWPDVPE